MKMCFYIQIIGLQGKQMTNYIIYVNEADKVAGTSEHVTNILWLFLIFSFIFYKVRSIAPIDKNDALGKLQNK